mgnify:CR=1 FL=1
MDNIKLKLTVAYDGTHYKGWQVQKNGVTVQQQIEEALQRLFPERDMSCGQPVIADDDQTL